MLLIPIICTAILWSSDVVQAHSGPVALAMPVEGIVVDGDLSDWPPDMVRYLLVIRTGDGAPLVGAGDFSGDFRVGYDVEKNLLYVAVDIVDDSVLLSSKGGLESFELDSCDLSIEVRHSEENGTARTLFPEQCYPQDV